LNPIRLYCGISNHGFGHLAQTAPILRAVMARYPEVTLIVQSEMPESRLRDWIERPFVYEPHFTDPGIPMHHAAAVDRSATMKTYRQLMHNWESVIQTQVARLKQYSPDLVLTNNSFTLSEAAGRCRIPCVHVCSLNWADIYRACAEGEPDTPAIYAKLLAAYNQADLFIRLTPAMPMPHLKPCETAHPIGRQGRCHSLHQRLQRTEETRFVLVSMGGMEYPLDYSQWPRADHCVYLIGSTAPIGRDDVVDFRTLGLSHTDLLRSCDALIGKPGYGTFVEAACNQTPVLYLPREDWPEQPARPWQRSLTALPAGEQEIANRLAKWLS
jgi:UDP:flavonoid glycosyltransferase YjiC (YdhE family)